MLSQFGILVFGFAGRRREELIKIEEPHKRIPAHNSDLQKTSWFHSKAIQFLD